MRMPSVEELKQATKSQIKKPMPSQNPEERIKVFTEVALGYTEEDALLEAARCLGCKKEECRQGCPVDIVVYRRSEKEMPARVEEVEHAHEEGIYLHMLTQPVEIKGDENNWAESAFLPVGI